MKTLNFILFSCALVFASLSLKANVAYSAVGSKDFSAVEYKGLLHSLNNVCGDTWCSGDFEYLIDQVSCRWNSRRCQVDLTIQAYPNIISNDAGEEIGRQTFPKRRYACNLDGFKKKGDVLRVSPVNVADGPDAFLNFRYTEKLYDALTSCIQDNMEPIASVLRFQNELRVPFSSWTLSRPVACEKQNPAPRRLFTDYYFTLADRKNFALVALLDAQGLDAAEGSCQMKTETVEPKAIRCTSDNLPVFCEVSVSDGVYLISKDYVDSTQVSFLPQSSDVMKLPPIRAEFDSRPLHLPNPAFCSSGLLANYSGDSSAIAVDLSRFLSYQDPRFIASRALRDWVQGLVTSLKSDDCQWQTETLPASAMSCSALSQGTLCTLKSSAGGYFRIYLGNKGPAWLFFQRYD